MIKISSMYIEEAIRIRKEFLEASMYLDKYKDDINYHKDELQKYSDAVSKEKISSEKEFITKMTGINDRISVIQEKIKPYLDTLNRLDTEQAKLAKTIKEKYPNITDDEIKENILPHILNIK